MNKFKFGIGCFLLLAVLPSLHAQKVVEAIVAVVNDDVITLSDFRREHDLLVQTLKASVPEEQYEEQYRLMSGQLLDKLITDRLLIQEAERMDLDVTERLNMMLTRMKEQYDLASDEQLAQAIRQSGVDFEAWKQERENEIKRDGVIFTEVRRNIVVDDNEVLNYYRQHPAEYTDPEEVTLKAVYLSGQGRIEEELRGRKQEILGKLEAGQPFSEVAEAYTEGPGKESGGDLGTYKRGELAESLLGPVENLQPEEYSPWIQMGNDWYLLYLVERKPDRLRPFDECRQAIEERLFSGKADVELQAYMEKLKARSFINILIENPLDYVGS
jgi:parvulin-like peptidyl-prolyl isomerase